MENATYQPPQFDFETINEAHQMVESMFDMSTKEGRRETERLICSATIRERDAEPEIDETERCRECGHTPETGACFRCKTD